MYVDFTTLVVYAVTGPKSDAFVHFKPNKFLTDQFQSGSLAWVEE